MRIHYLQHVNFEDWAGIGVWARQRGHWVSGTHLFEYQELPGPDEIDFLVIMGGPMGAGDDCLFPWMKKEKRFIEEVIKRGKSVLGICLGAQLIADVLGARVFKNCFPEIGWFPVSLTAEGSNSQIFANITSPFQAFHWHGDTFDIPTGGVHLAESEGCENQAFQYGERVLALQFHLESTAESVEKLVRICGDEIKDGTYIQNAEMMLSCSENFTAMNRNLINILDKLDPS